MSRLPVRLTLAAALLGVVLVAPWASAGERLAPSRSAAASPLAASSWELFSSLWSGLARWRKQAPAGPGTIASVHENNGCTIDPNGGCKPAAPQGSGCTIDPNGGGCGGL